MNTFDSEDLTDEDAELADLDEVTVRNRVRSIRKVAKAAVFMVSLTTVVALGFILVSRMSH